MDLVSILNLVAATAPALKALTEAISGAQNSKLPGAIDFVAGALPALAQLLDTFARIKNQTEAQHPEVWQKVREPYAAASSLFDRLRAAAKPLPPAA